MSARYDEFADWYVQESSSWGTEPLSPLPDRVNGTRVLELGCGHGRITRQLASAGARMTAVDISAELIARARLLEQADPLGIHYLQGDVSTTEWWDGSTFDGVVCEMALMDIDDLEGTVTTAARALVKGGWFAFSVVHPCHPGGPGTASGLPNWPPDAGTSGRVGGAAARA